MYLPLQRDLRKADYELCAENRIEKHGIGPFLKEIEALNSCQGLAEKSENPDRYISGSGKCWSRRCHILVRGASQCGECAILDKKHAEKVDQPMHKNTPLGSASKKQLIAEVKEKRQVGL